MSHNKRTALTLSQKYEITQKIASGRKQKVLALDYKVNESNIARIKSRASEICSLFESGSHGILKKKQRLNKHEQIENALYHWITTLAAGTPGLSTNITAKSN